MIFGRLKTIHFENGGGRSRIVILKIFKPPCPLLQENPDLLQDKSAISTHFKFYRVREHFLVCIKLKDVLLVLTIKHGKMDLSSRIGELEPTLVQEANLLHQRLVAAEKKRHKSFPKK